jgi:hypothetical protein
MDSTGRIVVNADTIAALSDSDAPAPVIDPDAPVEAPVPSVADKDPLVASDPVPASELALKDNIAGDFLPEKVTLTKEDKNAFIEALLGNTRFTRPFSLYGGKITGVFRSRTAKEHDAIVVHLAKLIRTNEIRNDSQYYRHMRASVLAAQVQLFNGAECEELAAPLYEGDAGIPQGWIGQYERWLNRDDVTPGLCGPLFVELQKFERKYWALIAGADDANFFNPAESTSD